MTAHISLPLMGKNIGKGYIPSSQEGAAARFNQRNASNSAQPGEVRP